MDSSTSLPSLRSGLSVRMTVIRTTLNIDLEVFKILIEVHLALTLCHYLFLNQFQVPVRSTRSTGNADSFYSVEP